MGHGADNDAELISAHLNLFGAWGSRTGLRLVAGELNENGVGQHGFLNGAADLRMIELQQSWTLRGAELAVQLGWTELTGAEVRSDFEDGLRVATRWGDLLFFGPRRRHVNHVGIYAGGGKMIHASRSSGRVVVSDLSESYLERSFMVAKRLPEVQSPK